MTRRFKFTMDIFKQMDSFQSPAPTNKQITSQSSDISEANINFNNSNHGNSSASRYNAPLSTPPSSNVSPNYTYEDHNDYFRYKSKPSQPELNTESPMIGRSPISGPGINPYRQIINLDTVDLDQQIQYVSPIEQDGSPTSTYPLIGRRGSIVPSNAPTSVNTPVSDDKSYMPSTATYKFICVDDNKINLRILSRLISKLYPSSEIHITTNPLEALTMIQESNYDLCFLDIEMPELSGKELAQKVRESNHLLGLIAVTTRSNPEHVMEYEELGMDTTFAKPLSYSYNHIMDSVDAVISRRKGQQA